MNASEREFYTAVRKACDDAWINDSGRSFVEMTCAENGYDCGEDCWTVAINTLEMFIDQGQLLEVAQNKH